jgi:hypothetical protein
MFFQQTSTETTVLHNGVQEVQCDFPGCKALSFPQVTFLLIHFFWAKFPSSLQISPAYISKFVEYRKVRGVFSHNPRHKQANK